MKLSTVTLIHKVTGRKLILNAVDYQRCVSDYATTHRLETRERGEDVTQTELVSSELGMQQKQPDAGAADEKPAATEPEKPGNADGPSAAPSAPEDPTEASGDAPEPTDEHEATAEAKPSPTGLEGAMFDDNDSQQKLRSAAAKITGKPYNDFTKETAIAALKAAGHWREEGNA